MGTSMVKTLRTRVGYGKNKMNFLPEIIKDTTRRRLQTYRIFQKSNGDVNFIYKRPTLNIGENTEMTLCVFTYIQRNSTR